MEVTILKFRHTTKSVARHGTRINQGMFSGGKKQNGIQWEIQRGVQRVG